MNDRSPGNGQIHTAALDWDQQGQPHSSQFDDIYFSRADGLAETRHVFLHHNRLGERFEALHRAPPGERVFTVGEAGFGSGLNLLAAWQLWLERAPSDAQLHLISVERYPLAPADLDRALALWPELATLSRTLRQQYPPREAGVHRRGLMPGRVWLTLVLGDAAEGLEQLALSDAPGPAGWHVDAWFLDGFAPAKNPDMWRPELFRALARFSRPGTTLATFTAAGTVRRGLIEAGFAPRKVDGFGRKRDMLVADFAPDPASTEPRPYRLSRGTALPWALPASPAQTTPESPRTALVIGAGLAGCHSARVLAERGWRVRVLERGPAPAAEASGNPQGLLYARLARQDSPLGRFNRLALGYAQNHYRDYWRSDPVIGQQCGLLQLGAKQSPHTEGLAHRVEAQEASALAGVHLPDGGLYFPEAGWLNPPALCRALLEHPNIQLTTDFEVDTLNRDAGQWQAWNQSRDATASASIAVLANAGAANRLTPGAPLKAIRGQISYLPATDASRQLKLALCGEGYLAPASGGRHCAGASFNLHDDDTALTQRDHRANLAQLDQFGETVSGWFNKLGPDKLDGRVGFRCTTPDYLPLVGPVPEREAFIEAFADLRRDARLNIDRPGPCRPGLYLNVGHGSRGLCYTPLAAELLAAHIEGEPPPVDGELVRALHPARFLVRDLIRGVI